MKIIRRSACLVLLCSGLSFLMPASAAEVYRWTDEHGRVHFGQRPPAAGAERIVVPSTAPSDSADPAMSGRRERQQRVLDAYEYERGRKREAEGQAEMAKRQRATRCEELKHTWRRLNHAGPVFYRRDDGGRDYLDDKQRAAELERLRPAYTDACGAPP